MSQFDKKNTVVIGSDHAAYKLKEYIKNLLLAQGYKVLDFGPFDEKSVDYPDYAQKVAVEVAKSRNKIGILSCGTGIGISIAANKIMGIRAALVHSKDDAYYSRAHNNSNILVLPGRTFNKRKVKEIIQVWLTSSFEGGRHKRRINKISKIEKDYLSNK